MRDIAILEIVLGLTEHDFDHTTDSSDRIVALSIYDSEYGGDLPAKRNFLGNIARLDQLKSLSLSTVQNEVTDLSALGQLDQLETLEIEYSSISDLSSLTGMTALKHISLPNSKISDITPLTTLTKLQTLSLEGNDISDISALQRHTILVSLTLSRNRITDITTIADLRQLSLLYLNENSIADISALSPLKNLQHLNIASNKIRDVSAIAGGHHLTFLDISNNHIEEAGAVGQHTKLSHLYLQNNRIQNIAFLAKLAALQTLNVAANPVLNKTPIAVLGKLQWLNVSNIGGFDIKVIGSADTLVSLNLSGCGISDTSPLVHLKKITMLDLSNNAISSIPFVIFLKDLRELRLANNNITELFGLHTLYNLRLIDLRNNPLGGKVYVTYLNGYDPQPQALLPELNDRIAEKCFEKGDIENALSLTIGVHNKIALKVQLHKLQSTKKNEKYLYRYYTMQCFQIVLSIRRDNEDPEVTKLIETFYELIEKSDLWDKDKILQTLKEGRYYEYNLLKEYAEYLLETPDPMPLPEMLFHIANTIANRKDLLKCLFIYRELVQLNHPLHLNVYGKIRHILAMNFAYTEEERQEHDKYRNMLENIEEAKLPYFNFIELFKKNYALRYDEQRREFRSSGSSWDGQMILRYIVLILLTIKGCMMCFD